MRLLLKPEWFKLILYWPSWLFGYKLYSLLHYVLEFSIGSRLIDEKIMKDKPCFGRNEQFSFVLNNPGVNFINILCTAFTCADPKSIRTKSRCQYLFTLLGSASVKAVHRTLMKLSPALPTGKWCCGLGECLKKVCFSPVYSLFTTQQ